MATIILSADGTSLNLDDHIARDDGLLRKALSPFYPELANAEIKREEKDGELTVRMSKRAGPKGAAASPVLAALARAAEGLNPALVMQHRLLEMQGRGDLDLKQLLLLGAEIERAAEQGEAELDEVARALKSLRAGQPVPSARVPAGF
jgi:hypothetical protein